MAARSTTPVRMRLYGTLSNFYNHEFQKANKFSWSIRLSDNENKELGYGYVAKNSDDGARIFELLKDGLRHKMIVYVSYLENAESPNHFMILKLVALNNWWFEGEE